MAQVIDGKTVDTSTEATVSSKGSKVVSCMNEALITVTSFPYINVVLSADKNYTIPYSMLKEVIIEGKTNMSRKGSIKFVDVNGEWPDILMRIGAKSNELQNVRKPNLEITFGWKKLKGGSTFTRSLDGMIIKSAIDLTDDGVTEITLEYIETISNFTNTIRYIDPNDIEIIYKNNDNFKSMPISRKLQWLTGWNGGGTYSKTTVAQTLMDNKILYKFNDTDDDKDEEVSIGFGDYLSDVINELTSKAKKKYESNYNYSYERGIVLQNQTIDNIKGVYIIPYEWKKAPDDSNTSPQETLSDMPLGPTLSYKKSATAGEKQIISFSSDLNTKTSLMMQSQDAITKELTTFTQDDMDTINDALKKKGMAGLSDMERPGLFSSSEQKSEMDKRNTAKINFSKAMDALKQESKTNQNSQLKAILSNNVFKANVKIMGDPTFGTDILPWKCQMKTNFDSVGGFGKTFGDRIWALTYVKHVFSEGSYTTEIELLAYPPPSDKISPDAPTNDKSESDQK